MFNDGLQAGFHRDWGFDIERDLLCTIDASGYFHSLNTAWERVLGWSREDLLGSRYLVLLHPDDVQRTARVASRVDIVDFENRFRSKDGSYRWLHWSAQTDGETSALATTR